MDYERVLAKLDPIVKTLGGSPEWSLRYVDDDKYVIFLGKWPIYWLTMYEDAPSDSPTFGPVDTHHDIIFNLSFVNIINFNELRKIDDMLEEPVASFEFNDALKETGDYNFALLHEAIVYSLYYYSDADLDNRTSLYLEDFGLDGHLSRLIGQFAGNRILDIGDKPLVGYESLVVSNATWEEMAFRKVVDQWARDIMEVPRLPYDITKFDQLNGVRSSSAGVVTHAALGTFALNLFPTSQRESTRQPMCIRCYLPPPDANGLIFDYEATAGIDLNMRLSYSPYNLTVKGMDILMNNLKYRVAWNVKRFVVETQPKRKTDELLMEVLSDRISKRVQDKTQKRNYGKEKPHEYLKRLRGEAPIRIDTTANGWMKVKKNPLTEAQINEAWILTVEMTLPIDLAQYSQEDLPTSKDPSHLRSHYRIFYWNLDIVLLEKVFKHAYRIESKDVPIEFKSGTWYILGIPFYKLTSKTVLPVDFYDPDLLLVTPGEPYFEFDFASTIPGVNADQNNAFRSLLFLNAFALNDNFLVNWFSVPTKFIDALYEYPEYQGKPILMKMTWKEFIMLDVWETFYKLVGYPAHAEWYDNKPFASRVKSVRGSENLDTWGLLMPGVRAVILSEEYPASIDLNRTELLEMDLQNLSTYNVDFNVVHNTVIHDPPVFKRFKNPPKSLSPVEIEEGESESESVYPDQESEDSFKLGGGIGISPVRPTPPVIQEIPSDSDTDVDSDSDLDFIAVQF